MVTFVQFRFWGLIITTTRVFPTVYSAVSLLLEKGARLPVMKSPYSLEGRCMWERGGFQSVQRNWGKNLLFSARDTLFHRVLFTKTIAITSWAFSGGLQWLLHWPNGWTDTLLHLKIHNRCGLGHIFLKILELRNLSWNDDIKSCGDMLCTIP